MTLNCGYFRLTASQLLLTCVNNLGASPKCDRHAGKRVDQPVVCITERYCLVIIHNWR